MSFISVGRRELVLGAAGSVLAPRGETQVTRMDELIEDVRAAMRESSPQAAVETVLERAVSAPGRLLRRLGEPAQAGIFPIHRDSDLTILNVVWAPLMVLLPHNHNMWACIGIYTGREDNILWDRHGAKITAVRAASLEQCEVFGLSADAIHSVTNPIGRLTGAIHIYGGDFFAPGRSEWDAGTLQERPWDLDAARDDFRKAAERFAAVP